MEINTEKLRHTSAHILAQALLKLYPDAKLGIGPATDNGFYYDFHIEEIIQEKLDQDKLFKELEEEIQSIINAEMPLNQIVLPKEEALNVLYQRGQIFKTEIIQSVNADEISFYKTGEEFIDLCRGPHLDHTGQVGGISLTTVSMANWLNDPSRPELIRISGVAFSQRSELEEYKKLREEIKINNHLALGKKLELLQTDKFNENSVQFTFYGNLMLENIKNKLGEVFEHLHYRKQNLITSSVDENGTIHKINDIKALILNPERVFYWKEKIKEDAIAKNKLTDYFQTFILAGHVSFGADEMALLKTHLREIVSEIVYTYNSLFKQKPQLYIEINKDYDQAIDINEIISNLGLNAHKHFSEDDILSISFKYEDPLNTVWEIAKIYISGRENRYNIETKVAVDLYRIFALIIEKQQKKIDFVLKPIKFLIVPRTEEDIQYAEKIYNKFSSYKYRTEISQRFSKPQYLADPKNELVGYYIWCGKAEEENGVISPQAFDSEEIGMMKVEEFLQKLALIH